MMEENLQRGIAIGEERGKQQGIAIGEERGEERGIAIGEERGINNTKKEMAEKMKNLGYTEEQIRQIVG